MIQITLVTTRDDPFGEPWPPATTDNWHVVRRAGGFTLWRAIRIAPSDPPVAAPPIVPSGRAATNPADTNSLTNATATREIDDVG
jgi:hypothetical protein